jgi:hypothetical protein
MMHLSELFLISKLINRKNISQQIASAPLYLFEIFEPLPLGFSGVD